MRTEIPAGTLHMLILETLNARAAGCAIRGRCDRLFSGQRGSSGDGCLEIEGRTTDGK